MTTPLPENCVPLLCQAAELGLKIDVKDSRTLTVEPAERCPPDFADTLRVHKSYLLILLRLPFVMVYSNALEETVLFCQDEDTKAALIEAGADEWSIYTKDELRILCEQNRIAPLTPFELRKVHEIKRTFNGRFAG
jgi:antirestriction protein